MSIVSDSNHWLFIASNGGLSAGRKDANYALFPYYTHDKLIESSEITGSKSIFKIQKDKTIYKWEPFSERFDGVYEVTGIYTKMCMVIKCCLKKLTIPSN